jgi:hypothetical protein
MDPFERQDVTCDVGEVGCGEAQPGKILSADVVLLVHMCDVVVHMCDV